MSLTRRTAIATGVLAAALPAVAQAATELPFTRQAFAEAQKSGQPILVHIWAHWCPVCAKQNPIIEMLSREPAYKDLTIFKVDFDTQRDVVFSFRVTKQSTLIVFHGTTEKGRSTGDSNPDSITSLIAQANS